MDNKLQIEKIKKFKELKKNWNGYNAMPIPVNVIEKAIEIITNLDFSISASPTNRGTIQIEHFIDIDNLMEIEIYNNKIILYLVKSDIPVYNEVEIDKKDIGKYYNILINN